MDILSQRLLHAREQKNLSQKELAAAAGIALRTYAYYEKGEREPLSSVLARLADALGVTTDYLLGRSDTP